MYCVSSFLTIQKKISRLTAELKKKIGQTQKIGSVARENTSLKMRLVARIIGLHI